MNSPASESIPTYEAVILAGGLGTRLRSEVADLPKVMAPVNGKPFISYVIDYLRMQGVRRIVFALGYKAEAIKEYIDHRYAKLDDAIVVEEEPLGTGGAIQLALQHCQTDHVVITNGDTLFKADISELMDMHLRNKSVCTMALKPMTHFDRYGVVEMNHQQQITSFKEKAFYESGLINGGLFIVDRAALLGQTFPEKFSFEKDFLERKIDGGRFYGLVQDKYFIDIGIPEDYKKAMGELALPPLDLSLVDNDWTIFLDRDGVINDERVGNYVLHWDEFIFSKGVLDAFKMISQKFHRVFIVSNQRGVGKGLMTKESLDSIHYEMQREVEIVGGHIDEIFYCTDVDDASYFRKPNPGMAYAASRHFNDVDFSKSIMVGNKPSDMQFGRNAGMYTVFLTTTNPDQEFPHSDIDLRFTSLQEFAVALK